MLAFAIWCASTPDAAQVAISDDHGTFRFRGVLPDHCSIDADLQGFATATALAVVRAGDTVDVAIHLDIAPVRSGITIAGRSVCVPESPNANDPYPIFETLVEQVLRRL